MGARARFAIGLYVLLGSSGCATILQGRYQDLTINSNPPGASFEVDGICGTTPATVPVRRKARQHVVTITKPGYETAQISVARELNMWLAGNVVFGGLPGLAVDLVSGGGYKLTSNTVSVNMQADGTLADRRPPPAAADSQVLEAGHLETKPPSAALPDRPQHH